MRILIIGASGFLGSRLYQSLDRGIVYGTFLSNKQDGLIYLDLTRESNVKSVLAKTKPDLIIHAGGLTNTDFCERDKEMAYGVNVRGTWNIVKNFGGKIIYFSTDYVFDGEKGLYCEKDVPNPINYYGWTKLEAEDILLRGGDDNIVIRVAGLYGHNERNNEFLNSFNSSIVYKATDLIGSTLLTDDIARYLPFFFEKRGIYHLTSGSAISRYDFALMVVRILSLPVKVIGKQAQDIYHTAKRPTNSSLISIRHNLEVCKEHKGLDFVKRSITSEERRVS